jgi:hypothetical protein
LPSFFEFTDRILIALIQVVVFFQVSICDCAVEAFSLTTDLDHLGHDLGLLKLVGNFCIKGIEVRQAPAHHSQSAMTCGRLPISWLYALMNMA